MTTPQPKFAFASPSWIAAAEEILNDLVAEHGREGRRFALCERFTDAPREIAPSGLAGWWFRIDGKSVVVGRGTIDDADLEITADYTATLPAARAIYTREGLIQSAQEPKPGVTRVQRGERPPRYMIELHNRLALLTA